MTLDTPVTIGELVITTTASSGLSGGLTLSGASNTLTFNGTGLTNPFGVANEAALAANANHSNPTTTISPNIVMASALGIGSLAGMQLTINGSITNNSGGALALNIRNDFYGNGATAPAPFTANGNATSCIINGSIGASGSEIDISNLSTMTGTMATPSTFTLAGAIGGESAPWRPSRLPTRQRPTPSISSSADLSAPA